MTFSTDPEYIDGIFECLKQISHNIFVCGSLDGAVRKVEVQKDKFIITNVVQNPNQLNFKKSSRYRSGNLTKALRH